MKVHSLSLQLQYKQCQKPDQRMNFRGIRASKFRHVYGAPAKKDRWFENVRISRNAHDSNYCAVNPKFVAVVVEVGGGGSFIVLQVDKTGRVDHNVNKVSGHSGPVLDIKWNPFNDNIIASASEDSTVKLWYIPDGGLNTDLKEPLIHLLGHRRRVGLVEWHPTAENILVSAGYDHLIFVWDITRGVQVSRIDCHTDTIYSMSFNRTGSRLATTCKDKKVRVVDPRTGSVIAQGTSHQGNKAAKVVYLGDTGRLFTTGFSKFSDREIAVWSEDDLSAPLRIDCVDSSSGILIPFYDHDTRMVYVAGKGDGNVRYYEIINESPIICYLSQFISGAPQKGFAAMPKRGVEVADCEIFRLYKLHATKDVVEPISMIVPRKSDVFQQDIYPETLAPIPALTASEWLSGKNGEPMVLSMKTASKTRTFKPVVYKPSENAIVTSERNNDRKFMFLLEETKPDYRPMNERKELSPSPQIDHRPYGANTYQKSSEYIRPRALDLLDGVTEKDMKTSLNLGTKFQEVQKKWSGGSLKTPEMEQELDYIYKTNLISGSNSVRTLSSRFDYKDNKEQEEAQEAHQDLKKILNHQQKQITNLKNQVEKKDQRITALEEQVRILSRQNTPLGTPLGTPVSTPPYGLHNAAGNGSGAILPGDTVAASKPGNSA